MAVARLLGVLDRRDRGLFERWALRPGGPALPRRAWTALTWAGSAAVTILAVLVPWGLAPSSRPAATVAAISLAASHLIVQALKRSVGRARPDRPSVIAHPDRFSFPSGHATAVLAVALSYAPPEPVVALPLVAFALLVGWSRVVLGVHYPGDVAAGQVIATLTVGVVRFLS